MKLILISVRAKHKWTEESEGSVENQPYGDSIKLIMWLIFQEGVMVGSECQTPSESSRVHD